MKRNIGRLPAITDSSQESDSSSDSDSSEGLISQPILQEAPPKVYSLEDIPTNVDFQGHEENIARLEKVKQYLSEVRFMLSNPPRSSAPKHHHFEFMTTLETLLDNVFCLYGVDLNIVNVEKIDSALKIDGVANKKTILKYIFILAELIVRLPCTFLKALNFNKVTICGKVMLINDSHKQVLDQKIISNAIFPINELLSFNQVERHFYKLILVHMQKHFTAVGSEWPFENTEKLTFLKKKIVSRKMGPSPKLQASYLDEYSVLKIALSPSQSHSEKFEKARRKKQQIDALMEIFTKESPSLPQNNGDGFASAVKLMKRVSEKADPYGLTRKWWSDVIPFSVTTSPSLFTEDNYFI